LSGEQEHPDPSVLKHRQHLVQATDCRAAHSQRLLEAGDQGLLGLALENHIETLSEPHSYVANHLFPGE